MSSRMLPKSKLAGLRLTNPLINGAYINSKTKEDISVLANSSAGAVVVGSITKVPRKPNSNSGYWRHKERFYSLNSFGMPNGGMTYFKKALPEIVDMVHKKGRALIVNVAGFTQKEFVELALLAQSSGADMVELNLGCPNVWDEGKQKKIISYHPELVKRVLSDLRAENLSIKVCAKISPLPPDILQAMASVIVESGCVQAVTATNSYPNASFTTGTDKPSDLLTGMTGRALKPISIGVVKQLRKQLPKNIDIIGCGGISSYNDVIDYLEAGASAVQLATALMDEGPSVFDKIMFQSIGA
jgi:dihydroorotate dehydrogenase (fumarate)